MIYQVNDIYPSIQGEGSMAGTPMAIVRLQGCDVGCPWCDTKETWEYSLADQRGTPLEAFGKSPLFVEMHEAEIGKYIQENVRLHWVLITGGEPALVNLAPIVKTLHKLGYEVALETSGTELGFVGAGFDWITVSPKIGMPGKKRFIEEVLQHADELKMVVGSNKDMMNLHALLKQPRRAKMLVSLQPVSQSPKATELCIKEVMAHAWEGWRLSVQLHKFIDVP